MREPGCSTFSTDESNRVLDRLAGLEKVITPDLLTQALVATEKVNPHRCKLNNEVMLWVVLAMGLFTTLPIRQVFKHARRMRQEEHSPPRSSLCEARKRLGVAPVKYLHEHVVRPLATPETPGAFWRGLRWVGIDGSVYDAPDSPANAAALARATGSRGDGAFPQVRKASLVELGTHVELALEIGGWQDGEQTLARKLWDRLPPDSLLLEDRGFFSYDDWKALDGRGQKLLVRVKKNLILEPFQQLSDGSYLAKIYPSSYHRSKDRNGLMVRVISYGSPAFKCKTFGIGGVFLVGAVPTLAAAAGPAWRPSRLPFCPSRSWPTSPSRSICPKASPSPVTIACPMRTALKLLGSGPKPVAVLVAKPLRRPGWNRISKWAKHASSAISTSWANQRSSAIKPSFIAAPSAIIATISCRPSNAKIPATRIASRSRSYNCSSAPAKRKWPGDWASAPTRCGLS